jgi:hypothetical protein
LKPTPAISTRRPEPDLCWVCGSAERPLRSDIHCSGRHLCPHCWTFGPRGYNRWVRSASALCLLLDLGRQWHDSGLRSGWLQQTAQQCGITAWYDVPSRILAPSEPFGWIAPEKVDRARAELARLEEEFNRSRIQLTTTAATAKAGARDAHAPRCRR